jgi:hypothetical protein
MKNPQDCSAWPAFRDAREAWKRIHASGSEADKRVAGDHYKACARKMSEELRTSLPPRR